MIGSWGKARAIGDLFDEERPLGEPLTLEGWATQSAAFRVVELSTIAVCTLVPVVPYLVSMYCNVLLMYLHRSWRGRCAVLDVVDVVDVQMWCAPHVDWVLGYICGRVPQYCTRCTLPLPVQPVEGDINEGFPLPLVAVLFLFVFWCSVPVLFLFPSPAPKPRRLPFPFPLRARHL